MKFTRFSYVFLLCVDFSSTQILACEVSSENTVNFRYLEPSREIKKIRVIGGMENV